MSDSKKLTQEEVDRLLAMIKKSLCQNINFPSQGNSVEFDIVGDSKRDLFTTKIYRGKINKEKYEVGARIKKDGILLLELHISSGKTHINPDGAKIVGNHWHIYTEKYGRSFAFSADAIESQQFIDNTTLFLEKFNVIEKPTINFQLELL